MTSDLSRDYISDPERCKASDSKHKRHSISASNITHQNLPAVSVTFDYNVVQLCTLAPRTFPKTMWATWTLLNLADAELP